MNLSGVSLNAFYIFSQRIGEDLFSEIWSVKGLFSAQSLVCFVSKRELKVFSKDPSQDLREYVAETFNLSSRHVLNVLECGVFEGRSYVLVDALAGFRLSDYLSVKEDFTLIESLCIAYEILVALEYLHRRGMTRNLVCPETIWIAPHAPFRDRIRIACFGYHLFLGDGAPESEDQTRLLEAYLAPELRRKRLSQEEVRTDLFGAGAILFRLLSGEVPEKRDSEVYKPMPVKQVNAFLRDRGVPTDVRMIVCALLKIRPGERFGSARDTISMVLDAIKNYTVMSDGSTDARLYLAMLSKRKLEGNSGTGNLPRVSNLFEVYGRRGSDIGSTEILGYQARNEYFSRLVQDFLARQGPGKSGLGLAVEMQKAFGTRMEEGTVAQYRDPYAEIRNYWNGEDGADEEIDSSELLTQIELTSLGSRDDSALVEDEDDPLPLDELEDLEDSMEGAPNEKRSKSSGRKRPSTPLGRFFTSLATLLKRLFAKG